MYIPKKDIVKFFIKETLLHQRVHSQRELADIINRKLKPGEYVVSGKRARSLALEIPGIKVHIETKRGKTPETNCPVCYGKLKKIYTKNLRGDKLLVRMQCGSCGYVGHEDKWSPKKYEFEYRKLLSYNG